MKFWNIENPDCIEKMHLYRLPTLDAPVPTYRESMAGLVIFPIFKRHLGTEHLERFILRSGCWARRSWVLFSDAPQMGIGIKFYVEMQVKDRVIPILRDNHVNIDNDVLFFDGSYFHLDNNWSMFGKKLAFANDSQFADYDWVWQIDTDCFMASPTRERFPFFEKATHLPVVPQSVVIDWLKPDNYSFELWGHIVTRFKETDPKKRLEVWIARAKNVVDADVVDRFVVRGTERLLPRGGIYGLPMKQYHTHHKADLEWLARAGQVLQDDEAVFSLWMAQGKPLQSLTHLLGIKQITDPYAILRQSSPYISHISQVVWEIRWRQSFDS